MYGGCVPVEMNNDATVGDLPRDVGISPKVCVEETTTVAEGRVSNMNLLDDAPQTHPVTGETIKLTSKECAQEALKVDPKCSRAWSFMATCGGGKVNEQRYSEGECAEKAVDSDPQDSDALIALANSVPNFPGSSYFAIYLLKDALLFAKDVENLPFINYRLGRAYYDAGKVDEARECFENALAWDQEYARAWYSLSLVNGGLVDGKRYSDRECFDRSQSC